MEGWRAESTSCNPHWGKKMKKWNGRGWVALRICRDNNQANVKTKWVLKRERGKARKYNLWSKSSAVNERQLDGLNSFIWILLALPFASFLFSPLSLSLSRSLAFTLTHTHSLINGRLQFSLCLSVLYTNTLFQHLLLYFFSFML